MATPRNAPAAAPGPAVTQTGVFLLGDTTVLRRNGNARPVPGILNPTVLKVHGLIGEQTTAPELRKVAEMEDLTLGAVLAELVERGLIVAERVKSEDPLDLDFTSPEVLDKMRVEAEHVKQAEEEARQRVEAERKAKVQAEARVRSEAQAKARADADAKTNAAALARLKAEKVARTQSDSEINARQGALDRAETEARARADALARAEAEAKARAESVRKAETDAATRLAAVRRMEAELKNKMAAMARIDSERQQKAAAESRARDEALALAENERKARAEAESRAEAERKAREQAEARAEHERKAREEAAEVARLEALALAEKEREARLEAEGRAEQERHAREETASAARAEALALAETERRARQAAEQRAESERQLREQAEANAAAQSEAKESAEERARQESLAHARDTHAMEERLRIEASERAQAEKAAREQAQALVEAERRLREEAEARMRALSSTEREDREKTEAQLKAQIEALTAAERQAREDAQAASEARRAADARAEAERHMQPLAGLQPTARARPQQLASYTLPSPDAPAPGGFEEMLAAATLFGASDSEAPARPAAPATTDNLAPPRQAQPGSQSAASPPPPPESAMAVDPDTLAQATRQALQDAETQSRLEQARFSRELEEQMAMAKAEQSSGSGQPAVNADDAQASREPQRTPAEQIRAIREAEVRDRAEEFARQQMADLLKLEEKRAKEEEQRRMLAEEEAKRRAREAAEIASRARTEREKFERERERQRKLAEAEAQAQAQAKARAEQPPESRWKLYTSGAVLLVAAIIGLFEILPFNFYLSRVEKAMSDALGQRVVIKSMHASLIPRPNIRLSEVTIGSTASGATIATVHAVPTMLSLLWGPLTFTAVELETVNVAQDFIPRLPDMVGMGGKQSLGFERIGIRNLRLNIPNVELPAAEVEVVWTSAGAFNRANILTYSRQVAVDLTPADGALAFRMTATNWQPLPGTNATIDQLKVSGTATRDGLSATEVDADLYGGKAQGSFTLGWGGDARNATASGELLLRRLDVAKLLPAMTADATATGLMDGNMKFSMQAPTVRRLLDEPQISTAFTIRRGWLGGIDMVRLLRDSTNRGGRTVFDEWTGVFAVGGASYSLRQMRLTSGPMTATGGADINSDGRLTGRINAQLSTGNGTAVQSNFSLGGTMQNIEVGN